MQTQRMDSNKTTRNLIIALVVMMTVYSGNQQKLRGNDMDDGKTYEIQIVVGDTVLQATLDSNPTSMDLISMLPIELELEDYASTEKIAYLPRKLSKEGAPSGCDPDIGDITYYAPWGNLAIFYKDFGYAAGLIKLGNISDGIEILKDRNIKQITIKRK